MDRSERIVARDALSSPLGVALRMKLNDPAKMTEMARQINARLDARRSLFPGNMYRVARYPGISRTRISAIGERISCRDAGERFAKASASSGMRTDAIRCRGGGQANLILGSLLDY
jgi:hypothetical protein